MPYLSLLFVLLLSSGLSAQRPITEAQLQQLEQQIDDIEGQERSQLKENYALDDQDAVPLHFYLSTWRIDTLLSMRIDLDFSTQGMNASVEAAAASYVGLQAYLSREIIALDASFEKILEEGQARWAASVKAEQELFEQMEGKYSAELGTIYSHNASSHYYEEAKARAKLLFQLYEDLVSATQGRLPSTQRN